MINLNKQRIAVYFYFFIVLSLIFSLSFSVQGDKITGSVVFETAGNIFNNFGNFGDYFIDKYFGKINLLQLNFLIIGILSTLALILFIARYIYETELELNAKFVAGFAIILLVFGVLFFGISFGIENEKITGYATNNPINNKPIFYQSVADNSIYKKEGTQVYKLKGREWEKSDMIINTDSWQPYKEIRFAPYELTQQAAQELTNNLLNLLLGEFAYDQVSQVCKEDWESSEPASDTPRTASSGIIDPLQDGVNENGLLNNCPQAVTTVTAQAKKTSPSNGILYATSWTINPCKESITYTVYMANSVDDRIGLESGAANKAKLISNSKHFTYPINYSSICIQVSDATIGDNGYSCFDIV